MRPANIAPGVFSARFWSDQLMNWAMKDPAFKVQLFRFVDVFPMLRTPALVHDYLIDYLSQPGVTLPPGMDLGLKAGGLAKGLMAKTIAGRITRHGRQLHRRRRRRLGPAHAARSSGTRAWPSASICWARPA